MNGFGGGVDHADEEDGDGKPFFGFVSVEVAERDEFEGLGGRDGGNTDDRLMDRLAGCTGNVMAKEGVGN